MNAAGSAAVIEIIVVNYNAGETLTRCVLSVLEQDLPVRVTVIDNASSDGSVAALKGITPFPNNVVIRENDENTGFARAINEAARYLQEDAQYVLILNPDCELLAGSLAALRHALDEDSKAAIAGPVVVDRQGRAMRGTYRCFPTPWSSFLTFSGLWRLGRWVPAFTGVEAPGRLPTETTPAEAVSGACMLVRRKEFLEVGCMDGAYGLHCEDLDLMYRLRQRGFHCLLVPDARVFHDQGLSSSSRPFWVHWQKHRGMQRFFQKFQAQQVSPFLRWLVLCGIWLRFAATLPLAWLRRNRGS